MILSTIYLIGGLLLILFGANWLTDGSSAIARRLGISDLIVGLTIVAFGTSAPELVISVISAVGGSGELAIGNAVGSNIFNILVIIGITATVRPMQIGRSILQNEIPLVILSSLVILIMANTPILDSSQQAVISRSSGLILLLFFAIFMRYTFAQARQIPQPSADPAAERGAATPEIPLWRALIAIPVGLGALIFGGDRFVAGASDIASAMGVSDAIIGLTIVACGTSLPELATSIAAALKGKPGIAIGNVIGSNIFNIFFVLGTSATITPLRFGGIGNVDLLTLLGASLLFLIFGWLIGKRTITRGEGIVMTLLYVAYVGWLVATA